MNSPLEHPIVEIASRLLTASEAGPWILDEDGVRFLERVLKNERHDPSLPVAIAGLLALGAELHHNQGSTEAAGALFALLGRLAPTLVPGSDVLESVKSAQADFGRLLGKVSSPGAEASAPVGSEPALNSNELLRRIGHAPELRPKGARTETSVRAPLADSPGPGGAKPRRPRRGQF